MTINYWILGYPIFRPTILFSQATSIDQQDQIQVALFCTNSKSDLDAMLGYGAFFRPREPHMFANFSHCWSSLSSNATQTEPRFHLLYQGFRLMQSMLGPATQCPDRCTSSRLPALPATPMITFHETKLEIASGDMDQYLSWPEERRYRYYFRESRQNIFTWTPSRGKMFADQHRLVKTKVNHAQVKNTNLRSQPMKSTTPSYTHATIYLSIYLSIYRSIYLSIYLPIYLSTYLSIYLFIYLSICLSTYLSIYLSIHLYKQYIVVFVSKETCKQMHITGWS